MKLFLQSAQNRRAFAAAFAISVLVNLLMLTGPIFMLQIYDRILPTLSVPTLVVLFGLVCVLYALMAVLDFIRAQLFARIGARLRGEFDGLILLENGGQGVNSSLAHDADQLYQLLRSPAATSLCDIPWTPIFILVLYLFHPSLGLLTLLGALVLIAVSYLNHQLAIGSMESGALKNATALDLLAGVKSGQAEIMGLSMRPQLNARWTLFRNSALVHGVSAAGLSHLFISLSKSLRLLLQSSILALGAYLVIQGHLSLGAMIAASILLARALAPIEQVVSFLPVITDAVTSLARAQPIIASKTRVRHPEPIKSNAPLLEILDLTVLGPNKRQPLLQNISLMLKAGENLGVIGKSGSGKSSLANAIIGLHTPRLGQVAIKGISPISLSDRDKRQLLGFQAQQTQLFRGSIAENIAQMDRSPDFDRVRQAADQVQINDLIDALPLGFETQLDRRGYPLSGGQVQRVALARAIYSDPELLILDEPNAALDADGTDALNGLLLARKSRGKSTIVMTHRPAAITQCERLLVLVGGAVKLDGPRDEVIAAVLAASPTDSMAS